MAKRVYFCVEMPTPGAARGATYGCSINRAEAEAALATGHKKGMKRLEIVERSSRPRRLKKGWLPPIGRA